MATKKSQPKKTTPKKKSVARKSIPRKTAAKSARKKTSTHKSGGKLHDVARSIGSTLGALARKTGQAVEAAKQAIPNPLHRDDNSGEQ